MLRLRSRFVEKAVLAVAILQAGGPAFAADPPFRISRILPWSVDDVGRKPLTAEDCAMEELAKNIDWLEHHININGTVVAKAPDVWGEARLTAHRQEFEDVLRAELRAFQKDSIQGAEFVSDQAFMAFAMALNAQNPSRRADGTNGVLPFPVINQNTTVPGSNTVGGTAGAQVDQRIDFGSPTTVFGFDASGKSLTSSLKLEQTEILDQLANYVNHLHALRRNNEGPDSGDAPGYAMNLVRIPVSVLPGQNTKRGYGAEITVTAEPYLGPELLPTAFREFVINDVIDQLSIPFVQYINGDPATVAAEMKLIGENNHPEGTTPPSYTESAKSAGASAESQPSMFRTNKANAAWSRINSMPSGNNMPTAVQKTRQVVAKKLTVNIPASATRRSTFPFAPSQLGENYGEDEMTNAIAEIYIAFQQDLLNRDIVHISDMQGYLREEVAGAFELLSQPVMQPLWQMDEECADGKLAEKIRIRDLTAISQRRCQFLDFLRLHNSTKLTASLAWCVYVNSLLLNERLIRDMKKTFGNTPNTPGPDAVMPLAFYGPNPSPEARAAFAEYVRIRWPIHIFALDPIVNEQNIADVRSIYRQMQMSVAVAYATGGIGTSAALNAMRKLQRDRMTIDLKRTAVAFGHGEDTFGWRFYPRFQTPPVEGNATVFFRDMLLGGPTDHQLEGKEAIEPGMRECSAIVIMPSFVPHVTFTTRGHWFKLNCPTRTGDSVHDTVTYSRAVKQMELNAMQCVQCAHLYRDGEVDRLMKRVKQLDRKLSVQTLECQVPIENTYGGCEILTAGKRELAPELTGWYGAPGYNPVTGSKLFLSGDSFNVTTNRLIVGNQGLEGKLLSRQILEVYLPPGLAVIRDRNLDDAESELYAGYIDAQVATPYGVSGHMLIPVVRASQQPLTLAVQPNAVRILAEVNAAGAIGKYLVPTQESLVRIDVPDGMSLRERSSLQAVFFAGQNQDRLLNISSLAVQRTADGLGFEFPATSVNTQFTLAAGTLGSVIGSHINQLLATHRVAVGEAVNYQLGVALSTEAAISANSPLIRVEGSVDIEILLVAPSAP